MNIGMILGGGFPGDVRVTKEARALLGVGHKIFLLSLGKPGLPKTEEVLGVKVIRIFPPKNLLKRMLRSLWSSISFDDPFLRRTLERVVKENEIEIVHCHDLSVVKPTKTVAKKFNIPVIADLHENFPEGIAVWRKEKITLNLWLYNIFSFPLPIRMYKKLEKSILQEVDRIITVVDEAKEHYVRDCEIVSEMVTVVMNTEDLNEFNKLKIDSNLISKYEDDFIITYIGSFGPHRGIETAIESMPDIIKKIPNTKLLLVGKGPDEYMEILKRMCRQLKVENKVVFTGWTDFTLVASYIETSDVCLVPHKSSGHTNTTIPHKLFQYMAKKKPVIVTDCRPLKRIVEECKCGLVVPSGDYREMAKAVVRLYQEKEIRDKLGKNGRRAVEGKYNWDNEAKKLVELYDGFELA